jgi:UDP-N-acetylglucosamine acyltransferase
LAIHPTAIVSQRAEIAPDVEIGPYAIIQGKVIIGSGTQIGAHAVIGHDKGEVVIGKNNRIFSGANVGGPPQDLSYKGEVTKLEVGDGNVVREYATLNCGTVKGGGLTKIGDNCMFMAYVHVAHDCQLSNNVVIANTTNFAGHVLVEDNVRIGGVCAFNQFIKIGRFAYIAGASNVNKDILPFTMVQGMGDYAVSRATNKVGLERAGVPKEEVENIHRAVRAILMGNRRIDEALELISKECTPSQNIEHLVNFVRTSERGIAR